jgi:hypothetical protein
MRAKPRSMSLPTAPTAFKHGQFCQPQGRMEMGICWTGSSGIPFLSGLRREGDSHQSVEQAQ